MIQLRNARKQRSLSPSTAVARNAKSAKILIAAMEASVPDPTLCGAHVSLDSLELSVTKVNVRKSRAKMAEHVLVKTSANVHLHILVFSVQEVQK